jgi:short-subunit dehydrogenase
VNSVQYLARSGAALDRAAVEVAADTALERFARVDLLVNNAGFGAHGRFETLGAARDLGQVRLNVEALVALTDRLAPAMLARGSGGIINVASTAAFQPVPYMAVYGATKAFVLSFSEALAEEFRGRGVRVLALCPGATRTNFLKTAGEGAQVGGMRTSEQVVASALRAYDRGRSYVADGAANKL